MILPKHMLWMLTGSSEPSGTFKNLNIHSLFPLLWQRGKHKQQASHLTGCPLILMICCHSLYQFLQKPNGPTLFATTCRASLPWRAVLLGTLMPQSAETQRVPCAYLPQPCVPLLFTPQPARPSDKLSAADVSENIYYSFFYPLWIASRKQTPKSLPGFGWFTFSFQWFLWCIFSC